MKEIRIAYVVADLKRVGPSNQTLNIIKKSKYKNNSIVITLFSEPIDSMLEEYKKIGIEVICLNLNRITFMLNGKRKLSNIINKKNILIMHSYGIKSDYICNRVSKSTNITHVITLRNYPKEDILTRMGHVKGKIALRNHLKTILKCKNVVCCSKTIYEKMIKDYPNKNFSYIQNAVDISKYKKVDKKIKLEYRKKYNLEKNKYIFISTGSFIPRKRINEIINGYIKANVGNSILLLLGDGLLLNDYKKEYSNYENIIFYGKSNMVEEFLQLSDCFISSSESEGLPNGVIEAIACGLPVILSDIPQHKEILNELPNAGSSYNLGNINSLANVISKKIRVNKINLKNSPFIIDNMSKKYVEYYERIGGNNENRKK